MKFRTLLVFIILMASCLRLFSQTPQDDVVYLNNGTFLRGKMIGINPGKSLKILLLGKDTMEIQMKDVKLITREKRPENFFDNYENGVKAYGYTFMAEFGYGVGVLEGLDRYKDTAEGQHSIMISVFNGFTITPIVQLGIGAGLDIWEHRSFLPVYIDLRVNVYKRKNTPFIYFNSGYSFGWMKGEAGMGLGGANAGIGAGAKFGLGTKQSIFFSLGYHFQQTRQWQEDNQVQTKSTRDAHFIDLKLGVMF